MVTKRRSGIIALSLGALGVVFGDIWHQSALRPAGNLWSGGRQIARDARKHSGGYYRY